MVLRSGFVLNSVLQDETSAYTVKGVKPAYGSRTRRFPDHRGLQSIGYMLDKQIDNLSVKKDSGVALNIPDGCFL